MYRSDIAKEVDYTVELGYDKGRNESKSNLVVSTVLNSITKALQRGESVHIQGFGTFRVRERKARYRYNHYFYRDKGSHRALVMNPAKKYVWFNPYTSIVNSLNKETENGSSS